MCQGPDRKHMACLNWVIRGDFNKDVGREWETTGEDVVPWGQGRCEERGAVAEGESYVAGLPLRSYGL